MGRFIKLNRLASIKDEQKETSSVYINTDCIACATEDSFTFGFKVTKIYLTHGHGCVDVTESIDEVMSMIHNQNRR